MRQYIKSKNQVINVIYILVYFFFSLFLTNKLHAQQIEGIVIDKNDNPIPLTNIWIVRTNEGCVSNDVGKFNMVVNSLLDTDSIAFSCIGYKSKIVSINELNLKHAKLVLIEDDMTLQEVVIMIKKPINEEFSISQLSQMDILNNPSSSADVLKAVKLLPITTNTDEGVMPSLRGSAPELSRIVFNNIPILNPIKKSMDSNGKGNFSIFNTGIIKQENIYASTPPIIYGNSTSGIIEIETVEQIHEKNLNITTGLSGINILTAIPFKNKNNFIQIFRNYNFSKGFLAINNSAFQNRLKSFTDKDIGVFTNWVIGKNSKISVYNYINKESGKYQLQLFNMDSLSIQNKFRLINILNYSYIKNNKVFKIDIGNDYENSELNYGSLKYSPIYYSFYVNTSYKLYKNNNTYQFGLINDYSNSQSRNSRIPIHYYALRPENPTMNLNDNIHNHNLELYSYTKIRIDSRFLLGLGLKYIRSIKNKQNYYTDFFTARYNSINDKHSLLFSYGDYNGYILPSQFKFEYMNQKSRQISLEYDYKLPSYEFKIAFFSKKEQGVIFLNYNDMSDKRRISGIEIFMKYIKDNLELYGSYSYLHSRSYWHDVTYKSYNNMGYNIKLMAAYNYLGIGKLSMSYSLHPGSLYTPICGAEYNDNISAYQPTYSSKWNTKRLSRYNRLDLNIEVPLFIQKKNVLFFFSVTNILNLHNERDIIYNSSYSQSSKSYYDGRIIYFGVNFSL